MPEWSPEKFAKLCPLVREPQPECFCFNLTSRNAEAAIYYCGGNFAECEIYRSRHGEKQPTPGTMPPDPSSKMEP